jgi:hypothetical protein
VDSAREAFFAMIEQLTPGRLSSLDWIDDWDPRMSSKFGPQIEQEAVAFFFEHFVLTPKSQEASRGYLEALIPMFEATELNSSLCLATQALAVRIYAHYSAGNGLKSFAQALLGQALRAAQEAIKDQAQATSNETVLSILLFALYECLTSTSTESWSKHIQGAVSIVNARAREVVSDQESHILNRAVRKLAVIDALQRRRPAVAAPLPQDAANATSYCMGDGLEQRLAMLLGQANGWLNAERDFARTNEVCILLEEAVRLQQDLCRWDLDMPLWTSYKSFSPNTPTTDDDLVSSDVWGLGPVHLYADIQAACLRNWSRILQLECAGVVIDAIKWLNPDNNSVDGRLKAAVYRVRCLIDDIAASVPFHLGYRIAGAAPVADLPGPNRRSVRDAGGYFLIWPLHICISRSETPDLQRKWFERKLQLILKRYGILEVQNGGKYWSHLHWFEWEFRRTDVVSRFGLYTSGRCSRSNKPRHLSNISL